MLTSGGSNSSNPLSIEMATPFSSKQEEFVANVLKKQVRFSQEPFVDTKAATLNLTAMSSVETGTRCLLDLVASKIHVEELDISGAANAVRQLTNKVPHVAKWKLQDTVESMTLRTLLLYTCFVFVQKYLIQPCAL